MLANTGGGRKGDDGDAGAAGADGAAGATGAAGADGYSVLNGAGVPSGGTGVDGDFYIDTTGDDIYGPKTAGAWGSATSLVGATGAAGADGAAGASGVASGHIIHMCPEVRNSTDALEWLISHSNGTANAATPYVNLYISTSTTSNRASLTGRYEWLLNKETSFCFGIYQFPSTANSAWVVGVGGFSTSYTTAFPFNDHSFGFHGITLSSSRTDKVTCSDDTTETETTISTLSDDTILTGHFLPGVSCTYRANGTLVATHTTNLPTKSAFSGSYFGLTLRLHAPNVSAIGSYFKVYHTSAQMNME